MAPTNLPGTKANSKQGGTNSNVQPNGPGGPALPNALSTVVYLHTDQLGSVGAVTDAYGSVVSRTEYDPWGKVRAQSGPAQTTRNYTGQKLDSTGLLYYNARYYDPALARFISADSIVPGATAALQTDFHEAGYKAEQKVPAKKQSGPADPQKLNRYSYVNNNPVLHNDPTGHCRDAYGNADETCTYERERAQAEEDGSSNCSASEMALPYNTCVPYADGRESLFPDDTHGEEAGGDYPGSGYGGHNSDGYVNFKGPTVRSFDWTEIIGGHKPGGGKLDQSNRDGGKKTTWGAGVSDAKVKASVIEAWGTRKKMETQSVPGQATRIRYRGTDEQGRTIEMWYNTETKEVESAYPVKVP